MTDRQEKLIENYVRTKVRSMLKEEDKHIPKNHGLAGAIEAIKSNCDATISLIKSDRLNLSNLQNFLKTAKETLSRIESFSKTL